MRIIVLFAGIAALAACSAKEDAAEAPAAEAPAAEVAAAPAADGAPVPGTYTVTGADKKANSLTIGADNTYAYTTEAGVMKGTVAAKDGKTCYDPEGDKDPTMCWAGGKPAEDGTVTATSDDGQTVTVTRAAS